MSNDRTLKQRCERIREKELARKQTVLEAQAENFRSEFGLISEIDAKNDRLNVFFDNGVKLHVKYCRCEDDVEWSIWVYYDDSNGISLKDPNTCELYDAACGRRYEAFLEREKQRKSSRYIDQHSSQIWRWLTGWM